MLINQSNQLLQYYQKSPIRLLSLPIEQNAMVQKLKYFQERRKHCQTSTLSSHANCNIVPKPFGFSKGKPSLQSIEYMSQEKEITPSPKSLELLSVMHTHNTHINPLSIAKKVKTRRKSSVLKYLMEQNTPSNRSRTDESPPLPQGRSKLQMVERKFLTNESISKIYRSHIQRRKREKELRNMLIVTRVKQSKNLNLVVRKLSTLKMAPI